MPRRPPPDDPNSTVAGLLLDASLVQPDEGRRWAYDRAARTILLLPEPIGHYVRGDRLSRLPGIGPAITRIILEYLAEGESPSVAAMIARTGRARDVSGRRAFRHDFISNAVVQQVLKGRRRGVSAASYRGDFQLHSHWSDGAESLDALVEACLARGYSCACVTDHSDGQRVPRGMNPDQTARQQAEIDRINERQAGRFRLFKGIEANIRADGSLDLLPGHVQGTELILAAPHSLLRSADDQTDRMLAAVRQRGVNVLAHPRGRRFNARAGVHADWDRVFRVAAELRVAIEIDGSPDRQDVDHVLARRALEAGCLFALDSDAHALRELDFASYALAHARLAGIPAERVINCWTDDAILTWAEEARQR